MKLIVQADDFAITDAVAEGILKCARDGILTQTGLMTNGPHSEYYAERMMKECPHIALGLEINLVSGRPLCKPDEIKTLVDDKGKLIRSVVHREMDQVNPHHVRYEDAYKEIEAQYLKFVEITGYKPHFFGLHSYNNEEMEKAMIDIQSKYHLYSSLELFKIAGRTELTPWYPLKKQIKEGSSFETQLSLDPLEIFMAGEYGYLTDHVHEKDTIRILHTHAGFIDKDLIDMSTLHMTRIAELNLLCCDEIKKWVKDNQVELINICDLNL